MRPFRFPGRLAIHTNTINKYALYLAEEGAPISTVIRQAMGLRQTVVDLPP